MKDLFASYEQAILLKELGFDEPCITYYYEDSKTIRTGLSIHINNGWTYSGTKRLETTLAPLKTQVFKWFRQKYNLFGCIDLQCSSPAHWYVRIDDIIENDFVYHSEDYHIKYNTYEEAEDVCINKLIEIIKTQ
jgi:hypothetical protein